MRPASIFPDLEEAAERAAAALQRGERSILLEVRPIAAAGEQVRLWDGVMGSVVSRRTVPPKILGQQSRIAAVVVRVDVNDVLSAMARKIERASR